MADALKKGSRVTGAERKLIAAALRKQYEAGESIRELAQASGRSYGFVRRVLSESGADLRTRRPTAAVVRGRRGPAVATNDERETPARESTLDALVRDGVVVAPRVAKSSVALPKRIAAKRGLSDIVMAQRG